jgi:ribonuclease P protein component
LNRLKTRAQFDAVLSGTVLAKTHHFVLHGCRQTAATVGDRPEAEKAVFLPRQGACIGAMVPKRWARRAVTRNLVKRQIYSLAQDHFIGDQAWAYVVRLRQGFASKQFPSGSSLPLKSAVRDQLLALFSTARQPC